MSDYQNHRTMPLFADELRVKSKAAPHIKSFREKLGVGVDFKLNQLVEWVTTREQVNASSVDRILRKMKQSEEINYEVVNRSQSIYRFKE